MGDRWTLRQTDIWTLIQTDRWTLRQTDRPTERWTLRQTDRQTDGHSDRLIRTEDSCRLITDSKTLPRWMDSLSDGII